MKRKGWSGEMMGLITGLDKYLDGAKFNLNEEKRNIIRFRKEEQGNKNGPADSRK